VPLDGLTIVVTRPRENADATSRALIAAGAKAIPMPLLDIVAIDAPPGEIAAPPDVLVFVSRNAATFGVPALSARRLIANVAAGQIIYAVGRATANHLVSLGLANARSPVDGEDSEALLAEPTFINAANKSFLIVKGESEGGGRQLIVATLARRGAKVAEFMCYRRGPRQLSAAEGVTLKSAIADGAFVLVGSIETLESLLANLKAVGGSLREVAHVLVPHPRVAEAARQAGAARVSVVSLEDNKLVESLSKLAS
jgi:uroporphyrinogen-III synthase